MIEEASAEEEELLGKNNDLEDGEEGEEGNSVTRDDELLKVNNFSASLSTRDLFGSYRVLCRLTINEISGPRSITLLFENRTFC